MKSTYPPRNTPRTTQQATPQEFTDSEFATQECCFGEVSTELNNGCSCSFTKKETSVTKFFKKKRIRKSAEHKLEKNSSAELTEKEIESIVKKFKLLKEEQAWKFYTGKKFSPRLKEALRCAMLEKLLPTGRVIVKSYVRRNVPNHSLVDYEDSENDMVASLLKLIDKYDPKFGTTFWQFANARNKSRIKGAIIDGHRKMQDYPRRIAKLRRELWPKINLLESRLGHKPTPEEIIEFVGEQYREELQDNLFWTSVYSESTQISGEENELSSLHLKEDSNSKRNYIHPDRSKVILDLLDDQIDVDLIIGCCLYNKTLEFMARTIGLSISAASKRRKSAIAKIRSKITYEEALDILTGEDDYV